MKYQNLYANGRWFRFTGRRLQIARNGEFVDLMRLKSGEAGSIHQALERFTVKVKGEGYGGVEDYLKHSWRGNR